MCGLARLAKLGNVVPISVHPEVRAAILATLVTPLRISISFAVFAESRGVPVLKQVNFVTAFGGIGRSPFPHGPDPEAILTCLTTRGS